MDECVDSREDETSRDEDGHPFVVICLACHSRRINAHKRETECRQSDSWLLREYGRGDGDSDDVCDDDVAYGYVVESGNGYEAPGVGKRVENVCVEEVVD